MPLSTLFFGMLEYQQNFVSVMVYISLKLSENYKVLIQKYIYKYWI